MLAGSASFFAFYPLPVSKHDLKHSGIFFRKFACDLGFAAYEIFENVSEYISEYTSKYVSEYTSEYITECTSECTSDYVREYISEYASEYTSEYIEVKIKDPHPHPKALSEKIMSKRNLVIKPSKIHPKSIWDIDSRRKFHVDFDSGVHLA